MKLTAALLIACVACGAELLTLTR